MHTSITFTRRLRLAAGLACSALIYLGSHQCANADGESEGQVAPLAIFSPVELDRCADGVCTIEFSGEPEYEYTIYASGDLVTWEPLGFFVETSPGQYEYVDSGAAEVPGRYYQIEVHIDPPAQNSLPPSYEQLRLELGDEAFGEWLQNNLEQSGNLQGIPDGSVDEMRRNNPHAYEQFEQTEEALQRFLEELQNASGGQPEEPEAVIPVYTGTFQAMGEDAFVEMLLENKEQWGNYQGVCGPALIEMEDLYPEIHLQFIEIEQRFQEALDVGPLAPEPPTDDNEVLLPPQLEQLRLELGDEGFAEWLMDNMRVWGNYQGMSETAVLELENSFPEQFRQFQETERLLQEWIRSRE